MPWIEISEEEYQRRRQDEMLAAILKAMREDDEDALAELWPQFRPSARILTFAKRVLGAAWIRRLGIDTRNADEAYGPGWLDDPAYPDYDELTSIRRTRAIAQVEYWRGGDERCR